MTKLNTEPTMVVPPEIAAELRQALVADLQRVDDEILGLIYGTDPERRRLAYQELVSRFNTRSELQNAAGWPDDRLPAQLTIRGERSCVLAIRCLTQHRDAQLDLRTFETLSLRQRNGSVEWISDQAQPAPGSSLQALTRFLADYPPPLRHRHEGERHRMVVT